MITGLHHYALAVPGLDVADDFLRGFGLETTAESGALVARCPGRDQDQVQDDIAVIVDHLAAAPASAGWAVATGWPDVQRPPR